MSCICFGGLLSGSVGFPFVGEKGTLRSMNCVFGSQTKALTSVKVPEHCRNLGYWLYSCPLIFCRDTSFQNLLVVSCSLFLPNSEFSDLLVCKLNRMDSIIVLYVTRDFRFQVVLPHAVFPPCRGGQNVLCIVVVGGMNEWIVENVSRSSVWSPGNTSGETTFWVPM